MPEKSYTTEQLRDAEKMAAFLTKDVLTALVVHTFMQGVYTGAQMNSAADTKKGA